MCSTNRIQLLVCVAVGQYLEPNHTEQDYEEGEEHGREGVGLDHEHDCQQQHLQNRVLVHPKHGQLKSPVYCAVSKSVQ